jgi:hypothetical protein
MMPLKLKLSTKVTLECIANQFKLYVVIYLISLRLDIKLNKKINLILI